MTNKTYEKLTNAQTVTDAIIAAGMPQYPVEGARFYGTSTISEPPTTIVHGFDDLTSEEWASIDGIVASQP